METGCKSARPYQLLLADRRRERVITRPRRITYGMLLSRSPAGAICSRLKPMPHGRDQSYATRPNEGGLYLR